jgi:deoxyribose-phosphate aldolase
MSAKSDIHSRLEGGLADPFLFPDEAVRRLDSWRVSGIGAAVAPPGLWAAIQYAPPKPRRIGAVAFPSGGQTITSKRVEVLECVRLGLCAAEIVLNHGYIAGNQWGDVEKEMEALLRTAPELEIRFTIEWGRVESDTKKRFIRLLRDFPPKALRVATGVYGTPLGSREVSALRAMLPKGVGLKAVASRGGASAAEYLDAGADLAESETPLAERSETVAVNE